MDIPVGCRSRWSLKGNAMSAVTVRHVRKLAARKGFALRLSRIDGSWCIVQIDHNWLIRSGIDLDQVFEFVES